MTADDSGTAGGVELSPCPFCGGEAKRFTIEEEGDNFGGDVIVCTGKCGCSSHVEFGRKENLVSLWNTRAALAGHQDKLDRGALRETLATVRDYVADAAKGALAYEGSGDGFIAMAKEDLARIDAALATTPDPTARTGEAVAAARAAVEKLANTPMQLSLSDWSRLSNTILAALPLPGDAS